MAFHYAFLHWSLKNADVNILNYREDIVPREKVDFLSLMSVCFHQNLSIEFLSFLRKETSFPQAWYPLRSWKKHPGFPIVLHGTSLVVPKNVDIINRNGGQLKAAIYIPEDLLQRTAASAALKLISIVTEDWL